MDVPLPGRRHERVAPVRAGAPRGPTKGEARGAGWRRSSHGRYVPADVEADGLQRTLEAGVLVPATGAVTGWAALGWLGGRWSTGLEADGVTPARCRSSCADGRSARSRGSC